ncbi:MAG: hypothetical protein CFH33_00015 [Alphaproteobacteria bacterium MarineAlpha9_Bin3]|nr:MAG: hypothetical protein CFH33_00015 [Alphaproteobacteria bacterium MarineAlpha9_Bin3]|tara:strand:+ start:11017 stop:11706 length:690 start_codon:yes stop_codon:yes gene_type:complete
MEFNNININLLDIVLFVSMLVSLVIGYSRGFAKETLSIINWLLAAWIAFKYYSDLNSITIEYIDSNIVADAISFGILFLLSIITLTFLSNFISKNIKNSLLAPLDRLLGMIFGVIRAIILVVVLFIAGNQTIWVNNTIPKWMYESYSYPIVISITNNLKNILPNEFFAIDIKAIDIQKLNINELIDKNKLFNEPELYKGIENESSYTPAEREQMNRLNNIETIDTNNKD